MGETDKSKNSNQLLTDIAKQVRKCQKCPLYKTAKNAVPGEGNEKADLVFIGEAPGKNEDEQGEPFVGRAGKLLDFLIRQIGYTREQVWIGNIIKHRPPNNRDPQPEEIDACKGYLTHQLQILNPKVIVTLGRFAMNYFLPNEKISRAHGKPYKLSNFTLYPVYHPAAGLRNPKMKTALIADFLQIPDILKGKEEDEQSNAQQAGSSDKDKSEQISLL